MKQPTYSMRSHKVGFLQPTLFGRHGRAELI